MIDGEPVPGQSKEKTQRTESASPIQLINAIRAKEKELGEPLMVTFEGDNPKFEPVHILRAPITSKIEENGGEVRKHYTYAVIAEGDSSKSNPPGIHALRTFSGGKRSGFMAQHMNLPDFQKALAKGLESGGKYPVDGKGGSGMLRHNANNQSALVFIRENGREAAIALDLHWYNGTSRLPITDVEIAEIVKASVEVARNPKAEKAEKAETPRSTLQATEQTNPHFLAALDALKSS